MALGAAGACSRPNPAFTTPGNDADPDSHGQGSGDGMTTDGGGGGDGATDGAAESSGEAPGDAAPGGEAGAEAAGDAPLDACVSGCSAGQTRCGSGGGLQTCDVAASGCGDYGPEAPCGSHQQCTGAAGAAACTCTPPSDSGCTAAGTFCASASVEKSCVLDAMTGCPYVTTSKSCGAHQSCQGSAPAGVCACNDTCTAADVGTYCPDGTHSATCAADGDGCFLASAQAACPGAQRCTGSAPSAMCACPAASGGAAAAGDGCASVGATACAGDSILTCATTLGCNLWVVTSSCAPLSLVCRSPSGTALCACPDNAGTDWYVDPVAGDDNEAAGVRPTGIASPAACRWKTLGKGLGKAGDGDRVIAISATPPVTFASEKFPLVVPNGVTLTTADVVPTPADYAINFNSIAATAAVSLGANTTLQGFSIADAGGNALADAVTCLAGAVTIETVVLVGTGGGTTMSHGLAVGGACSVAGHAVATSAYAVAGLYVNSTSATASSLAASSDQASFNGLRVVSGTVGAADLVVRSSTGQGVVLSPQTASATPKLTASNILVRDTAREGVLLVASAGGVPTLILTGGEVRDNGKTSTGYQGMLIFAGTATMTGTNVHGNGRYGLGMGSSTVTLGAGCHFDGNGVTSLAGGIAVESGTLLGTGGAAAGAEIVADANKGDGVTVAGGTATLHRAHLTNNDGRGLTVSNATVTLDDGSTAVGNGSPGPASGIRAESGTLVLGGDSGARVDVSANTGFGLSIGSATVTVTATDVHDNTSSGIDVGAGANPTAITVQRSTVFANLGHGVVVHRAQALVGGANAFKLDTVHVYGNGNAGPGGAGGYGVWLQGDAGGVTASLLGCEVDSNIDTGIRIEESLVSSAVTRCTLTGNDVHGNGGRALAPVGGINFATAATLAGFSGNKVHGNTGDEMGFAAAPNLPALFWDLTGGGACGAGANSVWCYDDGAVSKVGIRVTGAADIVHADTMVWANAVPSAGVDYSVAGIGSSLTSSGACSPPLSCP